MKSALFIVLILVPLLPAEVSARTTATFGESEVGQSCGRLEHSTDFDTLVQCTTTAASGGLKQTAPIVIGTVTAPPYTATTCDASKAGMIQYASSVMQFCNGTSWLTLSPNVSFLGTSASATSPRRSDDATVGLFSAAADTVSIATAGTQRLMVTATGSIGIGTAAPRAALDVAGSAYFGDTTSASTVHVGRDSSGAAAFYVGYNNTGTSAPTLGVGTYSMLGGNLGVGAYSGGASILTVGYQSQGTATVYVGSSSSYASNLYVGNDPLGTSNAIFIGKGGQGGSNRLEIGETPAMTDRTNAYIDLTADTTYTDYGLRIFRNTGANGSSVFYSRGTGGMIFQTTEAGPIAFNTTAARRVTIEAGGDVGIGTSTPAAKLDVTGAVKVANDATACSSANAGAIRWTGSAFQGCNGTSWASLSSGVTNFGAATTVADNTTYTAANPGIVVAYGTVTSGTCTITGYSDSASPPTTVIAKESFEAGAFQTLTISITFPVRDGLNYRVDQSGCTYTGRFYSLI